MKIKRDIILFSVIFSLVYIASSFQSLVIKARAKTLPTSVSTGQIMFGLVFPGEMKVGNLTVSLDGEKEVEYFITQKPPTQGILNLCPHLFKEKDEGEGDIESQSFLSSPSDEEDEWEIILKSPSGQVEAGDYGCDVGIEIVEEEITSANNGGGNSTFATVTSSFSRRGGGAGASSEVEPEVEEDGVEPEVKGRVTYKIPEVRLSAQNRFLSFLSSFLLSNMFAQSFILSSVVFSILKFGEKTLQGER